jgi:CHAT domain-containing protein/cytochrome c-type biogenesis protein CcmH/NrfG
LTRALDKHLDGDELNALVSLPTVGVIDSGRLSDEALEEARRHADSCQDCSRKVQVHKSVQSEISRMDSLSNPSPGCDYVADTEWLDVVAGLLPEVKTKELMKHAAQCGHCGPLLRRATETLADEVTPSEEAVLGNLRSAGPEWQRGMAETLRGEIRPRLLEKLGSPGWRELFSWPRPVFASVALAAVVLAAWLGLRTLHSPSADQLLAQAYTQHRTLEVRIPGAAFAPLQAERGVGGSNLDKSPALLKAEAIISEKLSKNPADPAWLEARARADLLDGNYESAIKSLQRALEVQPDSPQLLTDLGSAYFLRAESGQRPIDYGNAIESLGQALAKSPDNPVALFNRALACERMFLYTQADDDWEHYLRVDPTGEWADDVRRRLTALKGKLREHEKSQNESLLSPAEIARTGADNAAVHKKIDGRIEEYLSLAVAHWLPEAYPTDRVWATGLAESRAALAILAKIAVQKHADQWLADLLASSSSPGFAPAVAQLSAALKDNDTGDNVAARERASVAERLFLSIGNDAGALRARVEYMFASQDAQDGNECARAAHGILSRLDNRSYGWLKAQYLIEQGNCVWFRGDMGTARQMLDQASREAETDAYDALYLRAQDQLSLLEGTIGDLPSAWTRDHAALARFWTGQYPAMRGYNLYFGCYEFARAQQQPHLQLVAWRDGLALSASFKDDVIRAMAHSLMADVAIAVEQPQIAEQELIRANQLFSASPQIKSTRVAHMEAETRLGEVEGTEGKTGESLVRLEKLEPEISALSDDFLQVMFYTTLGQVQSSVGEYSKAESTLRSAIGLTELELRTVTDESSRLKWSEQTSNTYRIFAQVRMQRGDAEGALETWEAYRGAAQRANESADHAMVEPHAVATRLRDLTSETVVSYALFPNGMAIWVYDDRGVFAHWTQGKPTSIEVLAQHFRRLCSDPSSDESDLQQDARALYDRLVAPIEQHLSSDRVLVTELDDGLNGIPFDALLDTQNRYLGDRGPIVSSLGIYYHPDWRASVRITPETRALIAAVPVSGVGDARSLLPLPDALSEAEMVAHGFNAPNLMSGSQVTTEALISQLPGASVLHFAGHAISSQQHSGLLLSDGLLGASSLKKTSLTRIQLAVFSACDTQDGSTGRIYDVDGLVRVFLRAGVPHVVASRWNVNSAATRQFMNLFYRALLGGNSVAESIHQAQVGLRSISGMTHPYYWSAFTNFGLV